MESQLREYCEINFELSRADKNGVTTLSQLQEVEKKFGIVDKALQKFYDNTCPAALAGFYFSWLALHNRRSYSEYGPNPLTFTEIMAWRELMNEDISPYGIEQICLIDEIYLRHQYRK